MKWKPNARHTPLTAYSMWAMYLGILTLLIPKSIYYAASIDTNQRLWWVLSWSC